MGIPATAQQIQIEEKKPNPTGMWCLRLCEDRGSFHLLKELAVTGLALCFWLAGCKNSSQATPAYGSDSDIVQTVVAAGSGPLDTATDMSLRVWFSQHVDVAAKIEPSCEIKYKAANASWQTTPEGKACTSAAVILLNTGYGKPKARVQPQFIGKGGIYGNKAQETTK